MSVNPDSPMTSGRPRFPNRPGGEDGPAASKRPEPANDPFTERNTHRYRAKWTSDI